MHFFEAFEYCVNQNAILVEIRNQTTEVILEAVLPDHNYWLGGSDMFEVSYNYNIIS